MNTETPTPQPDRDDDVIGVQEAARILGVDRSTFRQYEDVPGWRTPGGHRRFTRGAVIAYREKLRTTAS